MAACVAACSQVLGIHDPVVEGVPSQDASGSTDGRAPLADAPEDTRSVDAGRCYGAGALCDDFERNDPRGDWDVLTTSEGATATIETNERGRVLAVRSVSAIGAALLERTLPGTLRRIRYEIDARWESLPVSGGYLFLRAGTPTSDGNLEMTYLYLDPAGVWFAQQRSGGPGAYVRLPLAASPAAWHHFLVEYEIGGAVQVTVDGTVQVGSRPLEPFLSAGPLRVSVGIAGVEEVGAGFSFLVDALELRAE